MKRICIIINGERDQIPKGGYIKGGHYVQKIHIDFVFNPHPWV